jgi:acyl-CoA synthetase (AMP-forming)/AMP-acid ligase II
LIVASDPALTEEELIAHCRTRLAGYKCPKRIVFVDSLARTATGKAAGHVLTASVANTRSPVSVWTKGSFGGDYEAA